MKSALLEAFTAGKVFSECCGTSFGRQPDRCLSKYGKIASLYFLFPAAVVGKFEGQNVSTCQRLNFQTIFAVQYATSITNAIINRISPIVRVMPDAST